MGALSFMRTLDPTDVAARADAQARAAAENAGIDISLVDEPAAIAAVCDLFDEVWGTDPENAILPVGVLRAMVHAGNYAAAGYRDGEMIGAVVGFLGQDERGPYLHSHILGVSATKQGKSAGFALKLHQRAWCLRIGISKVTWTFDPLVRKNAYFNLQKLGARADHYYENFYGAMSDGINAGDETDRVLIVWNLDDERVARAADGVLPEPDRSGADVELAAESGSPDIRPANGRAVTCTTPDDIVELRRSDPARALSWRRALRHTLGSRMNDGYRVSGFTRDGSYVLDRDGDAHA